MDAKGIEEVKMTSTSTGLSYPNPVGVGCWVWGLGLKGLDASNSRHIRRHPWSSGKELRFLETSAWVCLQVK